MTLLDMTFPENNAANFNTLAKTAYQNCSTNITAINTSLSAILATGQMGDEYDDEKTGGYTVGDIVYDLTTGFSYRAIQTQAEGAVQPLSDVSYWTLIAGDNKAELINALGSISSNTEIDLDDGIYVTATIGAALTFTFSNPPPAGYAGGFFLKLTNGGAYTITWPDSVDWDGAVAPSLLAAGINLLSFTTDDNGTTYRGVVIWESE